MKPTVYFCLLTATLALSEYPRLKYRGPPPFPKPPPYQQVQKKWQQHPPRPPIRSQRPIPVHMPTHHKIPMGMAASVNRPVAVPVRTFWKNTQTTFRPPIENHNHFITSAPVLPKKIFQLPPILPKKVFQSSPPILVQEYDFQVQSNNIPTPIKTIKQIGEKGPIHTIPAPNLSPADKPLVIEEVQQNVQRYPSVSEEVKHQYQRQPEVATYVQIQKSHQYQVTETPEVTKQNIYKNYYETPYQHQTQNLGPNELYQLINAYAQQQPATLSVLQDTQLQQDYLQQFPALSLQQPQNYVEQTQQEHIAMDKSGEEEPVKKELSSSLVTATYNLEPEASESIIQSQYVQNYFDTSNNNNANNVEPDAKPSEKNNAPTEGFYISLPNKEAADKLASLQAAGRLNNNLMQRSKNGELPVRVYVPDEGEESFDDIRQSEEEDPNYEDYVQDDLMPEEMNHEDESFGHRVKPKK